MEVRVHLMPGVRKVSSKRTRAMALSYSDAFVGSCSSKPGGPEAGIGAGGAQNESGKNISRMASGDLQGSPGLVVAVVVGLPGSSGLMAVSGVMAGSGVVVGSVGNGTDMLDILLLCEAEKQRTPDEKDERLKRKGELMMVFGWEEVR